MTTLNLDGTPRKSGSGERDWTDERVELLKKLWADGKSQDEIRAALGLDSRGAVSGKIARLGLSNTKPRPKPKAGKRRAASYHFRPTVEGRLEVEQIAMPDDVPPEQRVKLRDLESGNCRFFCGEVGQPDAGFCPEKAADNTSWCAAHARVVFRAA